MEAVDEEEAGVPEETVEVEHQDVEVDLAAEMVVTEMTGPRQ